MSMAPTAIGYDGGSVRDSMQAIFDKIDTQLLNPIYVKKNNKYTGADLVAGKKKFVFLEDGQLNAAEIDSLQNGWATAGWTASVVNNNPNSPTDSSDNYTWTLTLDFQG